MGEILHVGFNLKEDILDRYRIASNIKTITLRCTECRINTAGIINPPNMHLRLCPTCSKVLHDERESEKHIQNESGPSKSQRLGW